MCCSKRTSSREADKCVRSDDEIIMRMEGQHGRKITGFGPLFTPSFLSPSSVSFFPKSGTSLPSRWAFRLWDLRVESLKDQNLIHVLLKKALILAVLLKCCQLYLVSLWLVAGFSPPANHRRTCSPDEPSAFVHCLYGGSMLCDLVGGSIVSYHIICMLSFSWCNVKFTSPVWVCFSTKVVPVLV